MDYFESGVIGTKRKLWKKKNTVLKIIDFLMEKGYEFNEMVYGEPNDFVFASIYDDIKKKLSMKGSFMGIRIKMKKNGIILDIESNTRGVDNVRYSIFSKTEELLSTAIEDALGIKDVMKSSNRGIAQVTEYLSLHRKLRLGIYIATAVIFVVVLNFIFPLISYIIWILSAFPLLTILILYSYLRRR